MFGSGNKLHEVLHSIQNQTVTNYEVVIVDSSSRSIVGELAVKYGTKLIPGDICSLNSILPDRYQTCTQFEVRKLGLLAARFIGHKNSTGDRELLLDETRILRNDALERLLALDEDMVVIAESEMGHSLWTRSAELDKKVILDQNTDRLSPESGFLLPRYFRHDVLSRSFERLIANIPEDSFDRIIHSGHQLIFAEAFNVSNSITVCYEPLILHYCDATLREIVSKYYRYGKSDIFSARLSQYDHFQVRKRIRTISGIRNKLLLYPFYLVRALSCFAGYYRALGDHDQRWKNQHNRRQNILLYVRGVLRLSL